MGAPGQPLPKIENSSDLVHYFFGGAQNHEQEKRKKEKYQTKWAQFVLQGPQKHERTHPRAEWVNK